MYLKYKLFLFIEMAHNKVTKLLGGEASPSINKAHYYFTLTLIDGVSCPFTAPLNL